MPSTWALSALRWHMIRRYGWLVPLFLFPALVFGGLWWYVHRDRDERPSIYAPGVDSAPMEENGKLRPFIPGGVDPRKLLERGQIEKARELVAKDPRVLIYLEDVEWFRKLLDENPTL